MQEINYITPNIGNSQIIIGIIFALLIIIAMPIVGSLLLWLSAKLFKFKKQLFKTALHCILITFGIVIATNMILFASNVAKNNYIHVLLLLTTGIIAETISVKKLFKTSNSKAIGATMASFSIGIILLVVFIVLLSLSLNWMAPQLFQ